ncbi:MAG: NUDIX domain-containing protein [Candidatus Saccharimonadales bacterium]|jgi:8-oxo-dGTP diphosphatase
MKQVYVAPVLTVDAVIFQLINNELNVLLIKRSQAPFKNNYALPGGYNPEGETTIEAFGRILQVKAGLNMSKLQLFEQLYTFDTVGRDPRGHAVSVTYLGLGRGMVIDPTKTIEKPKFYPLSKLPKLAFDHRAIINYAQERLSSKVSYSNAIYALLPKEFTLTQLQQAYEAVLGRSLDKRNFRKRVLALKLLKPTTKYLADGAYRPARIYTFHKQTLQTSKTLID